MPKRVVTVCGAALLLSLPVDAPAKPPAASSTATTPSASSTGASTSQAASASASQSSSSAAFETQILSYRSVEDIAGIISSSTCAQIKAQYAQDLADAAKTPDAAAAEAQAAPVVIIYDQASFSNILAYVGFMRGADILTNAYALQTPKDTFSPYMIKANTPAPVKAQKQQKKNKKTKKIVQQTAKPMKFILESDKLNQLMAEVDVQATGATPSTSQTSSSSGITPSISFSPASDLGTLLSTVATSANTETSGSTTILDSALALAVTRKLKNSCEIFQGGNNSGKLTVVYPPLFGSGSAEDSAKAEITHVLSKLSAARANAYFSALNYASSLPPPANGQQSSAQNALTLVANEITDLNGLYDSLLNNFVQSNSGTNAIGGANIIQGKTLYDELSDFVYKKDATGQKPVKTPRIPAYVLLATVEGAGGTVRDSKTFWSNISRGDKYTYSGGAIAGTFLWRSGQNMPVYSDVIRCRTHRTSAPNDPTVVDRCAHDEKVENYSQPK